MKKAILFPLLFAGSATAVGAGGYYIYSTSTGEQTGKGVIINKSSQTSPKKDLSASVGETQKQDQNQEQIQEPEKNVETGLSATVDETKNQDQNQEQNQEKTPELEKNVEKDLSGSVKETQKQEQNQEKTPEPEKNVEKDLSNSVDETPKQNQNPEKTPELEKNVETDLSASVDKTKKQDQNPEKTPELEKNVETDLSATVDETQKQNQNPQKTQELEENVEKEFPTSINKTENEKENQQNTQEPEKNMQKDNNQSIRLGFWNVKDYTNKINSKKQTNTAKTFAIANVINSSGSDVVGLAEITTTGDGVDIVKELEKLNPTAGWKQMTTSKYGKTNHEEKYTFLYKSSLLEMVNFEENSNPYLIQDSTKLTWTRPVAAVKFQTKTNIKNDFTLVIGHFDTAGPYKKSKKNRKEEPDSEAPKQGQQEAGEARDLANVLNEIDKKDGLNNEIIFMGDTNILAENTEKLFESTLKSYRLLLDKNEKTTLSSKNFGEYANSYDKIFYKGNLNTKNAQKYDLYSIFEKNIVNVEEYDKMRNQDKRETKYKSGDPKDIKRITGISNHTMVYFDLELSESDKD
ncbi:endonuclease/exonuclease/phosphatase family protein [Mesomycoplasma ovipneumoniae]|uniref:endonuclease/exonuclease/phosphatase family protein n=1 Tax=Mesomycoplasma ovipneumoniae TaxID=29562 RepID=UPI00069D74BF|nr:endonuclease/exonuclease/phosphatase family protein [Mesomycoplasma ovipneumoniae]